MDLLAASFLASSSSSSLLAPTDHGGYPCAPGGYPGDLCGLAGGFFVAASYSSWVVWVWECVSVWGSGGCVRGYLLGYGT